MADSHSKSALLESNGFTKTGAPTTFWKSELQVKPACNYGHHPTNRFQGGDHQIRLSHVVHTSPHHTSHPISRELFSFSKQYSITTPCALDSLPLLNPKKSGGLFCSPQILMGASSSKRMGCCMKMSLAFTHSILISPSNSCTCFPGRAPGTDMDKKGARRPPPPGKWEGKGGT